MAYEVIVVGVSSGGMSALKLLFSVLPLDFHIPIIIVQHISAQSDSHWIKLLNTVSKLNIKEADEKEKIEKGNIYIAAPNYHLMVEENKTLSFTNEQKINFARPSIDVLFESAADVYKDKTIGIILTGSSSDGTAGLKLIKEYGGLAIAEDPKTATSPYMPASAISKVKVDHILPLKEIAELLIKISQNLKEPIK